MISTATFSPCYTFRYRLGRAWAHTLPELVIIGLNPSTADEFEDDPTIRRCVGFARGWGYGGITMLNLFAFRSTDPKKLKDAPDPVGPDNDAFLRAFTLGRTVLCGWGNHGRLYDRDDKVMEILQDRVTFCLAVNANGSPAHPLYQPKTRPLQAYSL